MNILVTVPEGDVKNTFFPKTVKDQIENLGSLTWNETHDNWTSEELRSRIANIDICITGWGTPMIDEYVLEHAESLKLIAHTGGTVAPVVSDAVYERNISVLSGNAVFAESVAEGVVCYILTAYRDIIGYANALKAGNWPSRNFKNRGLLDRTVGLVGYGMISRYLVPMLKVFNTRILVSSDHMTNDEAEKAGVEKVPLDRLFTESDVVSLHLSDTPKNHHRIGKRLLASIKDGGLFINTARGGVVDEAALVEELAAGRISAVLDVFQQEPLPGDSPLLSMENVICIPHMAGPTVDRRAVVTEQLAEDIERFRKGLQLKHEISRAYSRHMTRR